MKKTVLTLLFLSLSAPILASVARADMTPTQIAEKDKKPKPTPTPKPGPRDDGEGDQ